MGRSTAYFDRTKLFALSFSQPWATAILRGPKRAENRTWRINGISPRTPLWIGLHAAKSWEAPAQWPWPEGSLDLKDHVRGAILGLVRIVDILPIQEARVHRDPGIAQWSAGPWVWVIDRTVALARPIPCRGALGLWPVQPEMVADIDRQTGSVRLVAP